MQTNTANFRAEGAYGSALVSINGYTKDDRQEKVVQVTFGGGAASVSCYFSPDDARKIAAAMAAAAVAAEMPEAPGA